MKVDGLEAASSAARGLLGPPAPQRGGFDFAAQLEALVREADTDQKGAEHQASELAADRGDVVDTMVALSKAELSLRTVVEVRNRALEAVNEILRLQV
jgi:flagellar hook-basal body complex protein FliE